MWVPSPTSWKLSLMTGTLEFTDTLPCPPWKGHCLFVLVAERGHEVLGGREVEALL